MRLGKAWEALLCIGVLAGALALRLPHLAQRPMHGDEANQAVRTGQLLEEGVYHYDPTDHHGPSLYFAAWFFCRATARTFADTTEWSYRLVPVTFSLLTLLIMFAMGVSERQGLFVNRSARFTALLGMAVSPAMVYYSRFFIQETMLVTFLAGMLLCAVRYAGLRAAEVPGERRSGRRTLWAAAGFGAFAGLAAATKETAVLSFAAAAVATVAACGIGRLRRVWRTRDAVLAAGVAIGVAALLFSSFFTYPRGIVDALFSTAQAYLKRATAVPEHQHPWNFYLKILFWFRYGRGPLWSEAALLVPALIATVTAFLRFPDASEEETRVLRWTRFLAVYTLVLTALYSAIPYKTPWCALSFLHGVILLAGMGVGQAVAWLARQNIRGVRLAGTVVVWALVAFVATRHAAQAYRACFRLPADPRNPYVYAHTGTDALNLVAAIEEAARAAQGTDTPIAVAVPVPDTWPLPWYLRAYTRVGYWTRIEQIPESFHPVVVVAAADQGDVADARFGTGRRASFYGIRPGVLLNLFVPVPSAP